MTHKEPRHPPSNSAAPAAYRGQGLSPRVGCACHSMRSVVIHASSLLQAPSRASTPPKMKIVWFTCGCKGCASCVYMLLLCVCCVFVVCL